MVAFRHGVLQRTRCTFRRVGAGDDDGRLRHTRIVDTTDRIFRTLDAESTPKAVTSLWDTGRAANPISPCTRSSPYEATGSPRAGLLADYPNGWTTESIQVLELDASLSLLRRMFDFDLDDVDGAIAELDRLHSQADPN